MNEEQVQHEKIKSSIVWAVVFFVLLVVIVVWMYFIRLSFARINEGVKTNDVPTNQEAITTIEEAVRNFGSVLEQADKLELQKNIGNNEEVLNNEQKKEPSTVKTTEDKPNIDDVAKSVADIIETDSNQQ